VKVTTMLWLAAGPVVANDQFQGNCAFQFGAAWPAAI